MADARAAAIYRHMKLPVPTQERVCKVYITARDLQPELLESYADKLAAIVVNAAMAKGVTRIELHFPGRQAVVLDADSIRTALATEAGFWPAQLVPAQASVYNLMRLGAYFEPWRPQVAVGTTLTPTVSGDEPAVTEG